MFAGIGAGLLLYEGVRQLSSYTQSFLVPTLQPNPNCSCMGFNGICSVRIDILYPEYSTINIYVIYVNNGKAYILNQTTTNSKTLTTCTNSFLIWGNPTTTSPANLIIGEGTYTPPGKGLVTVYFTTTEQLYYVSTANGIEMSYANLKPLPQQYNPAVGEVFVITDLKNVGAFVWTGSTFLLIQGFNFIEAGYLSYTY
ncbi:hypothetical protein SBV1_gp23 [Sulfolobales Beppu virus 1]|nr:hypothetical protein SBV1_gp23 [Sulfolobales Beppu virus 1]